MSQSITTLSPTQLKNLKAGDKITIWWKKTNETDTSNRHMLFEGFPKNVGVTFSTVWKADFQELRELKTGDILKVGTKTSVTVVGGNFNVWKGILNWMLECCNGAGLARLQIPEIKPYTYLFLLKSSAIEIGCKYLPNETHQKMAKIEEGQIHADDVRALWFLDPSDDDTRKFIADHVAIRFWEKKLKDWGAYQALRKEIPDLDKKINEFCEEKKAERAAENQARWDQIKAERKAARAEENKQKWEQIKKERDEANKRYWEGVEKERAEADKKFWEKKREKERLAKRGVAKKANPTKQEPVEKSKENAVREPVSMSLEIVRKASKDCGPVLQLHLDAPPS
ncbi:hypothetical protein H2200_002401 [Cladophialophora chaetospira]|uniref:Uncharacterized protein n=1 Tax=Cladophialophora chaetospira TaxID=386627 RepID=A0AA38XIT4_9EURO|nr:hypothetical protein H2200_002401 [Cladophialophora chaetospira]